MKLESKAGESLWADAAGAARGFPPLLVDELELWETPESSKGLGPKLTDA
jgi:hypothetical protein